VLRGEKAPDGTPGEPTLIMREAVSLASVTRADRTGSPVLTVVLHYYHPIQGVLTVPIEQAWLVTSRSDRLFEVLSNHHIDVPTAVLGAKRRELIVLFLSALVKQYGDTSLVENAVTHFGPRDMGGRPDFVLGNWVHAPGVPPRPIVLAPAAAEIAKHIPDPAVDDTQREAIAQAMGEYRQHMSTLYGGNEQMQPDVAVHMSGFATALSPFIVPESDLGGLVVLNSNQSGSGKTSLMRAINRMYVRNHRALTVGDATLQGFMRHAVHTSFCLPVCRDDIGSDGFEAGSKMLAQLAYDSADKSMRLRQTDTTADFSPAWASWLYATTNLDPHSALAAHTQSSQGSQARMLSIKLAAERFGTGDELQQRKQQAHQFDMWLTRNGGVVGQEWVAYFLNNLGAAQDMYSAWVRRIAKDVTSAAASASERFQLAICAAIMTACELSHVAGIQPFAPTAIYSYVRQMLTASIQGSKEHVLNDSDLIQSMISDLNSKSVAGSTTKGVISAGENTQREIVMHYEPDGPMWIRVWVSVEAVKVWCRTNQVEYSRMLAMIKAERGSRPTAVQHSLVNTTGRQFRPRCWTFSYLREDIDAVQAADTQPA
jgi:NADH:ubiquinone oxidoreductase subunit